MSIRVNLAALFMLTAAAFAQPQSAIPGVIAAGTEAQVVKEGFVFTEGPVGSADGGLYFSDVRDAKIYRLDPAGKISVLREKSNGANGLTLTKAGDVYAAEGAGKRISHGNQTGQAITVVDQFNGKPFGAPNDLIMNRKGGIYFTDPGTQAFDAQNRHGDVYYLAPGAKEPVKLDSELMLPNGLSISINGKALLVDDTLGTNVWAYHIQPGGTVKNKHVFATIPQLTDGKSLADGMCMDRAGRIYVTTGAGLQIFDSAGKFLGAIKTPKQPANCAFSGPGKKTLYVTARESLYRIEMLSQGPTRAAK